MGKPEKLRDVFALAVDLIDECKTNPREYFDEAKLQELADDINIRGVKSPVLVRKHPEVEGRYELIYGHRRLRACALAGIDTIPAMLEEGEVSALDVLETQLAENDKHQGLTELEEGKAYIRLMEEHGRSATEIAALTGKNKATIYARMKLCELVPKAQTMVMSGKLDPAKALLIARMPPAFQLKAAEEITRDLGYADGMSFREAQRFIHDRFMLKLADAPFSLKDAELVAEAGSCVDCPKRTGNAQGKATLEEDGREDPDLFGDIPGSNICTDPECYQGKVDADWSRRKAAAEAEGKSALEGEEARKAIDSTYRLTGDYVRLTDRCMEDNQTRTYGEILGKSAPTVPVREGEKSITELIPRARLADALKTAGVSAPRVETRASTTEAEKLEKAKAKARRAAFQSAIDEVVTAMRTAEPAKFWPLVAEGVIRSGWNDTLIDVISRRADGRSLMQVFTSAPKIERKKGRNGLESPIDTLLRYMRELPSEELPSLVIEILVTRGAFALYQEPGDMLAAACAALGVDWRELVNAELAKVREEQKTAKVEKKKAAKPAAKPAKEKPAKKGDPEPAPAEA